MAEEPVNFKEALDLEERRFELLRTTLRNLKFVVLPPVAIEYSDEEKAALLSIAGKIQTQLWVNEMNISYYEEKLRENN